MRKVSGQLLKGNSNKAKLIFYGKVENGGKTDEELEEVQEYIDLVTNIKLKKR